MESIRSAERVAVAPPPMPIAAPGRRVTVTPAMFVAGLVVLVILAFVGYLGIQLLRYAEVTPVGLTSPANFFSTIDAETTALEGTSGPGALITIRGPGDELYSTRANEEGTWRQEVPLARGRNDFAITATDRITERESTSLQLTINRPLPVASLGASPSAAPPVTLTMSLSSPLDGAVSTDGNVVVSGITSGSRVTIERRYIPVVSASPSPVPTPFPTPTVAAPSSPSPTPSGSPPPIVDLTIPESGAFSETLALTIGSWELTITTFGIGVPPVTETRMITVSPPVVSGVQMVINVSGRNSWVRATADGVRIPGLGTLSDGDTRTLNAVSEVCLRTGNAGALQLNLNGLDIGFLGRVGQVGSWIFRPGLPPEPTELAC